MKISSRAIDRVLLKEFFADMTRNDLLVVIACLISELENRDCMLTLREVVELNRSCVEGLYIAEKGD